MEPADEADDLADAGSSGQAGGPDQGAHAAGGDGNGRLQPEHAHEPVIHRPKAEHGFDDHRRAAAGEPGERHASTASNLEADVLERGTVGPLDRDADKLDRPGEPCRRDARQVSEGDLLGDGGRGSSWAAARRHDAAGAVVRGDPVSCNPGTRVDLSLSTPIRRDCLNVGLRATATNPGRANVPVRVSRATRMDSGARWRVLDTLACTRWRSRCT